MRLVLPVAVLVLLAPLCNAFQSAPARHNLLLTDQRLKRLKRDRDRQTQRWVNFEARIKSAADSTERGFELALYYKVTGDEAIPAEAERWIQSHPCEQRQVALLKNVLPDSAGLHPEKPRCQSNPLTPLAAMRDSLFASFPDNAPDEEHRFDVSRFLALLKATSLNNADEIYAAAEILTALGRSEGNSVREQDAPFFNSLPVQFLLSLKPAEVNHPAWKVHIAALALIALDPNSDSAQFLQGWAIEDRQMIQDGPGVAYELLWADPYLPGVGYQNLDPWWYDENNARLLARTNWSSEACSISIGVGSVRSDQCPPDWQSRRMEFGHLSLLPMNEPCVEIAPRPNNAFVMLRVPLPNGHLKMTEGGKSLPQQADRAGLWRVPSNINGKICTAR